MSIREQGTVFGILNDVEGAQYTNFKLENWCPADAILVACYLFGDDMILRKDDWHATVSLSGLTRGQMLVDHLKDLSRNPPNVRLIEQCNVEFFKRVILWSANIENLPTATGNT